MKKQVGTIDLTPTPTQYAKQLIAIIEDSDDNSEGKEWARQEIIKFVKAAATIKPESWGKEDVISGHQKYTIIEKNRAYWENIVEQYCKFQWNNSIPIFEKMLSNDAAGLARYAYKRGLDSSTII